MIQRTIIAAIAACSLIASLSAGAAGDQNSLPSIPTTVCNVEDLKDIVAVYNFDSPGYKGAAQTVPAGVKSYLAQVLTERLHSCATQSGKLAYACTPAKNVTDPGALWKQLTFCEDVLALGHPAADPPPAGTLPLLNAQEPTFYVLLGVGAGPGGAPGGTSPTSSGGAGGGKGGGGGGATGSTATGSSVDIPSNLLLFLLARGLQKGICDRSPGVADCDAQHPVAVVPEPTWNLEDLRTQCAGDPYVPSDPNNPYGKGHSAPAGHGTLGAIVLNGSIVTADGTFAVVTIYGSSEANYTAQVVGCKAQPAGSSLFSVWSDSISDGNKTTALSFFPLALAGALIEAHAAAKTATLPSPSSTASPTAVSQFLYYQTDVALGTFASNASSLTLGNPSSGLTLRHSFEAWTKTFLTHLGAFCSVQTSESVCQALKYQTSP
jgi:hypothetical protein